MYTLKQKLKNVRNVDFFTREMKNIKQFGHFFLILIKIKRRQRVYHIMFITVCRKCFINHIKLSIPAKNKEIVNFFIKLAKMYQNLRCFLSFSGKES